MTTGQNNLISQMETTYGSLLHELQIIWEEVGESDAEKDRILVELEQECLEVYRRKVDQANKSRAQLRQAIADAESDLAAICSSMGERPVHIRQSAQNTQSLKAELRAILPEIEEMHKRKSERKNQFLEVLGEIERIKNEIYRSEGYVMNNALVDETDLSLRKLEELKNELQALQTEKSERLKKVLEQLTHLYSFCSVLGLDFKQTACAIHTSLGEVEGSKDISNDTIEKLGIAIHRLREIKLQRMQQLQDLATSLLELWNLMDTPTEEQMIFQKVTCNIASSEEEIAEPDMLSAGFISYVEAEVSRLEELKMSRMKELVLKKKAELEDICRKTHLIPELNSSIDLAVDAVESGAIDAALVLEQIELQISRVQEEALSRKEILEKVEKWMSACDEESWLEEYNRDDNRYNAGRGAHLTLKRAEKARALVNKLPAMVETLTSMTMAWEKENGIDFTYDGVHLLSMLEGYMALRQEKELERKRQRDQKKLQGQLLTEQEALYGSKPSPMKNQSAKKGGGRRLSCGVGAGAINRRLSIAGQMLQTPNHNIRSSAKKCDRTNPDYARDDGLAATLSSGRRGLDLATVPMKQQQFPSPQSTREMDSSMRKPFSPISSTDSSSRPNPANIIREDLNKKHNQMLHKTLLTTPSKTQICFTAVSEVENRTPQAMPIPTPSTPSTISFPMQMAMTPAPAKIMPLPTQTATAMVHGPLMGKAVNEEIEYSFEERRAGFVVYTPHHSSLATPSV